MPRSLSFVLAEIDPALDLAAADPGVVVLFALTWMGVGLAIAVALYRHSDDLRNAIAVGLLTGPFFLAIAFGQRYRQERRAQTRPFDGPVTVSPGIDILVLADGQEESRRVAGAAVALLRRVGRVAYASPAASAQAVRRHAADGFDLVVAATETAHRVDVPEQAVLPVLSIPMDSATDLTDE